MYKVNEIYFTCLSYCINVNLIVQYIFQLQPTVDLSHRLPVVALQHLVAQQWAWTQNIFVSQATT